MILDESNYNSLDFESIKIGLASPEKIRSWSHGEVTEYETINYKTSKPVPHGLFCEAIFGPMKDYECYCGKYKKSTTKAGEICDRCHVQITSAKVRRERMGHIELCCPVTHLWYVKGTPSRIGTILEVKSKDLDDVIHYNAFMITRIEQYVTDMEAAKKGDNKKNDNLLVPGTVINQRRYDQLKGQYGKDIEAKKGAPAIYELLQKIDVEAECATLREKITGNEELGIKPATGATREKLLKRYEVFNDFLESGNKPEWMVLTCIPVMPPDLRPLVPLDGGRFAASDLNELYRKVITRNNRLKKEMEMGLPEICLDNERRLLQDSVDKLIDNTKRQNQRPDVSANGRAYKSLTDLLKGKQGRFRQNLLGKRVDFSGRSVIVVGPELKIHQCGLPKEMALELFKPFVMRWLKDNGKASNEKNAKKMVERVDEKVWDALEVVIKDHPVMLNRAPTLHRLSIQAFEPVLVEGRAIKLHPLVCTAFNADFDGDQMAVHVPLSNKAQSEARNLMLASNNLLKPSDGRSVTVPTQDMVLGSYYLTMQDPKPEDGKIRAFTSEDEAIMAYDLGEITLHDVIKVRIFREIDGVRKSKIIETTLGKIIFNRPIPQDLGIKDRSIPENEFELEVDYLVNKKQLGKIIDKCIAVKGVKRAAIMLDEIKAQGYKYSTISGLTVAVFDATIPAAKKQYVAETEARIEKINEEYAEGYLSDKDRSEAAITEWAKCTELVGKAVAQGVKDNPNNPISIMVDSGARGSTGQLNQLAGMRGLISNTAGKTIEVPIKAGYREGLNVQEYFVASRGARKGLTDTALKTADSGYLTRRLVDVAQDVIVTKKDCGCRRDTPADADKHKGILVKAIFYKEKEIESLAERLTGRYLVESLYKDGELVCDNEHMMTEADAKRICEAGFTEVEIRSPLTCECEHGICTMCYGNDLATTNPINIGEAAGIFAAQSIGEPGTQLTMRTFHTGGVTSEADITQGLPRVEELFEVRTPKPLAVIAKCDGQVTSIGVESNGKEKNKGRKIKILSEDGEVSHPIVHDDRVLVKVGEYVTKGTRLTFGSPAPADILEIQGLAAVQDYIISEIQATYRNQGVDINDKHIEVIIRQLLRNVEITDPGSTNLLAGVVMSKSELRSRTKKCKEEFDREFEDYDGTNTLLPVEKPEFVMPTTKPIIKGLTKAALAVDSFLSAASFQEANRALTDAAVKGKVDHLLGLKENVIIGRLLPAGTGMKCYNDVEICGEDCMIKSSPDESDVFPA